MSRIDSFRLDVPWKSPSGAIRHRFFFVGSRCGTTEEPWWQSLIDFLGTFAGSGQLEPDPSGSGFVETIQLKEAAREQLAGLLGSCPPSASDANRNLEFAIAKIHSTEYPVPLLIFYGEHTEPQ